MNCGQVEQRREEGGRHQQRGQADRAEDAGWPSRRRAPARARRRALDDHEGHQQHDARREQREDARVGPAPVGHLVEREQQRDSAARQRATPGSRSLARRPRRGSRDLRQVTKQASAAIGRLTKKIQRQLSASVSSAAEQRAGRVAEARPTPMISPPASAACLGEDRVGHAEDRRPHHRAADAHQGAAGDQPEPFWREPAEQREGGEDRGADEEDRAGRTCPRAGRR